MKERFKNEKHLADICAAEKGKAETSEIEEWEILNGFVIFR